MKEEVIAKNVKELQDDIKYSFKQTSEVIDIIYRKGVNDAEKEIPKHTVQTNKEKTEDKKERTVVGTVVVASSKDLNKQFGSKGQNTDELTVDQRIQRAKRDAYYDILSEIEKQKDLSSVYIYVKNKCKEFGEDGVRNENRRRRRENPWF